MKSLEPASNSEIGVYIFERDLYKFPVGIGVPEKTESFVGEMINTPPLYRLNEGYKPQEVLPLESDEDAEQAMLSAGKAFIMYGSVSAVLIDTIKASRSSRNTEGAIELLQPVRKATGEDMAAVILHQTIDRGESQAVRTERIARNAADLGFYVMRVESAQPRELPLDIQEPPVRPPVRVPEGLGFQHFSYTSLA